MTTWTATTVPTNTFDGTTLVSSENGYVAFGYVADGYISGVSVWGSVSTASTTWTPA